MKQKHTDKTINGSRRGEYIFIEEVEAHLTKSFQEILYRKIKNLFKSQQDCQEEYEVTIFVASHKNADDKINRINKRILKNLYPPSHHQTNKRER